MSAGGSIVSWDASGGIATKNAPLMVQPGSMLLLDNVRQERKGEWRTRAGCTHNVADDLPGANVPVMCTEAPWGGFVGLTRETAYGSGGGGRVYSPTAGTRWITPGGTPGLPQCSQLTPSVWARSPVAPMVTGAVGPSQVSTAQGGGYRLTAYWSRSPSFNTGIQVILQTTDGATVNYFPQWLFDTGAYRPRVVYSSAANQLCLFYFNGSNNLVVNSWNAATGAQVATSTIATDGYAGASQSAYLDAIYYGGPTITIAYRNSTGAGNLSLVEYNAALNTATLYPQTVDCSKALSLLPDPDASGTRFVGVGTITPEVRVLRLSNVGVVLTNDVAATVDAGNIAGCAYNAGGDWMIVYGGSGVGTVLAAVKKRAGVLSAVRTMVPTSADFTYALISGAWRESGTDAMRYIIGVDGVALDDPQPTYLEMALEFENGSAQVVNNWKEPQARLLTSEAALSTLRGGLGQVQRLGVDKYLVALGRLTQFTTSSDGLSGNQYAIDAWTVQYLNATTYTNQNIGKGTQTPQDAYIPAGMLLHTATGQIICAHGASANPFKPSSLVASVGAGSLASAKVYRYGVSVVMSDENGNDWRSPMSTTKAITPGGSNNTVTISGSLTPFENQIRRRVVQIWRTDGNGSTYKLLHVIDDIVSSTVFYSFVDTTGDVGTGEGYIFQLPGTTGGELEAALTPPFSYVTLWNGRLWGVNRDFPSRVHYSKPLSAGLLPEFPRDFVTEVADPYGPATELAAMDDKVVLFKATAMYVAGGRGPGNDGSGTFYSFNLITNEVGSTIGTPVLSTGSEVYTVAQGGLYRLSRSQQTDFIGAALDLYLSMPLLKSPETVTGMVLSTVQSEVRIQTTNYRFVHDRVMDVWSRDTGGMSAGIAFTRMCGALQLQAFFLTNGQMWIESVDVASPNDAGTAYAGSLRSPWMRPANMEGQILLSHLRALGECTAVGSNAQPTITIYFDNDDSIFESFQPRTTLTDSVGPIRADCKPRRQRCTAFSPQLTLPAGNATIRFDAWSALASVMAGMNGITARDNWAPLGSGNGTAVTVVQGDALTLNSFGLAPITNTDGFHLQVDSEWYVDFGSLKPTLNVTLSIVGKIAAAPLPGGVSVWATNVENDNTASGTLLATVNLPAAGTGGVYQGVLVTATLPNPGGIKYITVTSFAGSSGVELPSSSVSLSYFGFEVNIMGSA